MSGGSVVGWESATEVAADAALDLEPEPTVALVVGLLRGVGGEFLFLTGVAVLTNGAYRLTPPAYSDAMSRDSSWKCTDRGVN